MTAARLLLLLSRAQSFGYLGGQAKQASWASELVNGHSGIGGPATPSFSSFQFGISPDRRQPTKPDPEPTHTPFFLFQEGHGHLPEWTVVGEALIQVGYLASFPFSHRPTYKPPRTDFAQRKKGGRDIHKRKWRVTSTHVVRYS